jgi:hypothetical protein
MRRAALLLPLLACLLGSQCSGIPVFLVDADRDDDGEVDADDVALVAGCQGADVSAPPPDVDFFGCPLPGDPPPACAAADVDRDGAVDADDLALVEDRLGRIVCNGSDELCGRRFDQVVHATTHNAMGAIFPPYSYSILFANQCSGVPTQLADGVRSLMLDIHWWQRPGDPAPDLFLCHSDCAFGSQRLVEGLSEVRAFLDARPGEVVSFIIETNADSSGREAQIRDAFAASGLLPHAHVQAPGAPWPTLAEMRAAGRRLVVLTDDSSNAGCGAVDPCPWYHYLWADFAFETPFQAASADEFTCDDLRGEPGNDLFVLNHFLTQNVGSPFFAQQVNHEPLLSSRALACWRHQGQVPNFVTLDYYEIGSLLRSVDLLNYLWGQTGGAAP